MVREAVEFVTFKWKPKPGYRSTFGAEQVNTLRSMLDRNYKGKHRLTCVTDDPEGIDGDVRVLPLWTDYAELPSPHGGNNPACYRRLKLWSREAADIIGPRICAIDLDVVITRDITGIVERPEDVVLWGDYVNKTTHYNGSLQLIRAGSRPEVWEKFDPVHSPKAARAAGFFGSDQAWLCLALGGDMPRWRYADGVVSFRIHCQNYIGRALPSCARVVFFHGQHDPWDPWVQDRYEWVREHYR